MTVDNSFALPLYHQVARILRQRIEDGLYPVGGRLLSEDEFAKEFEVSRATIRQAIGELVIEGLVVRRQGRGTFVETANRNVIQQRFRGSLGEFIQQTSRATTRDVAIEHDATFPTSIAEALQLDEPKGTIVRRTRTMDGLPFVYMVAYLPPGIGRTMTEQRLREHALMELLLADGIVLASATQSIRAELADVDVCPHIEVELGSPVLYVERLVQDSAGRPVDFVRSWYRGDRYEYTVTLDLGEGGEGVYINLA